MNDQILYQCWGRAGEETEEEWITAMSSTEDSVARGHRWQLGETPPPSVAGGLTGEARYGYSF